MDLVQSKDTVMVSVSMVTRVILNINSHDREQKLNLLVWEDVGGDIVRMEEEKNLPYTTVKKLVLF